MDVREITLTIDNFDNAAMVDDRSGEVVRILLGLVDRVEQYGVVNAFEGRLLMDSNGNVVGECDCQWDEGDDESE